MTFSEDYIYSILIVSQHSYLITVKSPDFSFNVELLCSISATKIYTFGTTNSSMILLHQVMFFWYPTSIIMKDK